MNRPIAFTLNGLPVEVDAPPMTPLLEALRAHLGFLGTKYGCGEGECGACTVLIDGDAVMSCLVPLAQAEGREVTTIEGLADGAGWSDLQQAFLERGSAQCGICTPGMLMAAAAYLDGGGSANLEKIRDALGGNLCRCTGYTAVVAAVVRVAIEREMRDAEPMEGRA